MDEVQAKKSVAKLNAGVYHGGEVNAWDAHMSELGRMSEGYALLSIEEGWAQLSAKKHNGWLGCCLHCKECLAMTGRIVTIPIGDAAYTNRHRNTNNWFRLIFITGFVGLVQHDAHMSVPPFKNQKTLPMSPLIAFRFPPNLTLFTTFLIPPLLGFGFKPVPTTFVCFKMPLLILYIISTCLRL